MRFWRSQATPRVFVAFRCLDFAGLPRVSLEDAAAAVRASGWAPTLRIVCIWPRRGLTSFDQDFANLAKGAGGGARAAGLEGSHNHPARDARALAQSRLLLLLALEVAPTGWGADRQLLKLGFEVAQSSVAKYMVKRRGPPSEGWRTLLHNQRRILAPLDLFVVLTIGFDLLYAFVIVRLGRRDLVWINVTAYPTADWPRDKSRRHSPGTRLRAI